MNKVLNNVIFDLEKNYFEILKGSVGSYSCDLIKSVKICGEEAKYRGKSEPFKHTVLIGSVFNNPFADKQFYVGVKIILNDDHVLAIYMSDDKTTTNTDIFFRDQKEAEKIKKFILKYIINK